MEEPRTVDKPSLHETQILLEQAMEWGKTGETEHIIKELDEIKNWGGRGLRWKKK